MLSFKLLADACVVPILRRKRKEWTRERVPLGWAATQHNLGNALLVLGERNSDAGQLEQAVDAYRKALKERTREHVPREWAMTQNTLGRALWRLGQREGGTGRLEQAVEAFRNAISVYEGAGAEDDLRDAREGISEAENLLAKRRIHPSKK
jgi:tetratricopeptide (TPR) repeat protein